MISGNILITGGVGFLGRAFMTRAFNENWPCNITVYSRDEFKQDLCKRKFPNVHYVLGDVRDIDRLSTHVDYADIVINAAALKYVPESETNVNECFDINIGGTKSVISAVRQSRRCKCLVGISTDKAVQPVSTYGISKAAAEKLYQEASRLIPDKKFVQTRYGNVIGSTGSVVPVFKRMASELGFVTITDPESTRFWHSVDDAIDMIVHLILFAESGDIIIPNPFSMYLEDVVTVVAPEARIELVGLRPGEKKHEKLLQASESVRTTSQAGHYMFNPDRDPHNQVFEITSDVATRMPYDVFRKLVDEAALV